MAASSTLQSAVVEKVAVRLVKQLAATQHMARPATRPLGLNAGAPSRR